MLNKTLNGRKLWNESNILWVENKVKEGKEKNEGGFVAPLEKYCLIEDSSQCNHPSQTLAFVFSF